MTTPEPVRVPALEFAARNVSLQRSFQARQLPRLTAMGQLQEPVILTVSFAEDAKGLIRLHGAMQGQIELDCHRCTAVVEYAIAQSLELCLADEPAAIELADEPNLYVTDNGWLNLVALVEDEILLALPCQPCSLMQCPNAPGMNFPDPTVSEAPVTSEKPFAALAGWRKPE